MENLPRHNPLARYNVDENESNLSLFQGQLGRSSGSTNKRLKNEEWCRIMLYVFHDLPEVKPFIKFSKNLFQYAVTILHPTDSFSFA
jgi:hypothetical protein